MIDSNCRIRFDYTEGLFTSEKKENKFSDAFIRYMRENLSIEPKKNEQPDYKIYIYKTELMNYLSLIKPNIDDKGVIEVEMEFNEELFRLAEEDRFVVSKPELCAETTIEFNQERLEEGELPEKLQKIFLKFDGLCELISNFVLINDLLGKSDGLENILEKQITVDNLNRDDITNSHLINVYSFFRLMIAFFLRIYPDNIFSFTDQWKLVAKNEFGESKVDKQLLKKGLDSVENGVTLKLEVFEKSNLSLAGHSLLIKKIDSNQFIFFDPSGGEYRNLTIEDIGLKIDEQLMWSEGPDILLMRGDTYLNRLRDQRILQVGLRSQFGQ